MDDNITVDEQIIAVQRQEFELLKKKYITQKEELAQLRSEREGLIQWVEGQIICLSTRGTEEWGWNAALLFVKSKLTRTEPQKEG